MSLRIYDCHGTGRPGGGLALICQSLYNPVKISRDTYSSYEYLATSLKNDGRQYDFITIYRPPGLFISAFLDNFASLLETYALGAMPLIMARDLNIHWDYSNGLFTRRFKELLHAVGLVPDEFGRKYVP